MSVPQNVFDALVQILKNQTTLADMIAGRPEPNPVLQDFANKMAAENFAAIRNLGGGVE